MGQKRPALTAFLDSSVLFTAVNSPTGGSAKLFTLKKIRLFVSPLVLTETERNIRAKLSSFHLKRFLILVKLLTIYKQTLGASEIAKARQVIVPKDAAILAVAKIAACDFLVTLDIKHFHQSSVIKYLKPQQVVTPKELLDLLEN